LELNDVAVVDATNDDVYNLVVTIAAGKSTVEDIATTLQDIIRRSESSTR